MIRAASCVILDFDGPVCSVFAGQPATTVAAAMIDWLAWQGVHLYPGEQPGDPLEVLRDAGRKLPAETVAALEAVLTRHEVRAAETSWPTEGAEGVIKSLVTTGRTLAVASNNAAAAIVRYLDRTALTGYFDGGVHGRPADPALMKPDPDCILRALRSTRTIPSTALMVGDSASDFEAADRAGVAFLGFAVDQRHAQALRSAGAAHVIRSWEPVMTVMRDCDT